MSHACRPARRSLPWLAIVAVLAMTRPLMAAGVLKGPVTDRTTKDGLPGASVVVKGTGIGAATNPEGVYIIPKTPTGEQTIVVTYGGSAQQMTAGQACTLPWQCSGRGIRFRRWRKPPRSPCSFSLEQN